MEQNYKKYRYIWVSEIRFHGGKRSRYEIYVERCRLIARIQRRVDQQTHQAEDHEISWVSTEVPSQRVFEELQDLMKTINNTESIQPETIT